MVTLPSLLLVTGAVLLGIYLGIFYLRGVRPKRLLLGAHVLMGIGGVEQLALLIHGTPSGAMAADSLLKATAGLFALAIFSGLTAPLLAQSTGRKNGEFMLATHAGVGIAGFVVFLVWISNI
jgi:uncharacterized membrane protein